ncbi:MAG: hypothetical protein ACREK8_00135 [Gemmatimonadales bacterium]
MRIGAGSLATVLAALSMVASALSAQHPAPACHHPDDFTDSLLSRSRYTLSFPKLSYLFDGSGLDVNDQYRIVPLQSDSLCRIAARTINRDQQQPDSVPRSIYLLKVGKLYWAVDRSVNTGRFYTVFIVDGTLTKILFRTEG